MPIRLTYAYVRLLFLLELVLLFATFLIHANLVFAGATEPNIERSRILFRAAVLTGFLTAPFIKDSLAWLNQIKTCPSWMWKGSLVMGVYVFPIAIFADPTIKFSGFPIPFEAISICILYSVLRKGYLDRTELMRRSLHSIVIGAVIAGAVVASRAGYLHYPGRQG